MAKKTKFTRKQIRSVRQAHREKTPIKQIAKDHNLKYGQVTYILYTLRGIIQTKKEEESAQKKSSAPPQDFWTWVSETLGFK